MLQANENRVNCKTCTNIIRHQKPGYTQQVMVNCMQAAHRTKGSSKLERLLAPFLEVYGFEHYVFNGKPPTIEFGSLCPDYVDMKHKRIVELYGNYWHAHPVIYKPDDLVFSDLTAQKVWDSDAHKTAFYVTLGFDVIVLWEKDVRLAIKQKRLVGFIAEHLGNHA